MAVDFAPFVAEPAFLGRAHRLDRRRSRLLLGAPLLLTLAVIGFEGILGATRNGATNPLSAICAELWKYHHALPLPGTCNGSELPPDFSIWRDAFTVIGMIALAITPILIYRQWLGFAAMASHMADANALTFDDPDDRAAFDAEVAAANVYFEKVSSYGPFIMLISTVAIGALATSQATRGVFYLLRPGSADADWLSEAYRSWWAGAYGSQLGFAWYALLGSFCLYVGTVQNLVGLRVILAYWRTRRLVTLAADPVNADGYFGWLPVRTMLTSTYIEISLHGIVVAAIGVGLPPGGITGPYAFGAAQWIATLPLYVLFPIVLARQKIAAYKERETENLRRRAAIGVEGLTGRERYELEAIYNRRIALVRNIPALPFRRVRDIGVFLLSIVADLTAVIPIVLALRA